MGRWGFVRVVAALALLGSAPAQAAPPSTAGPFTQTPGFSFDVMAPAPDGGTYVAGLSDGTPGTPGTVQPEHGGSLDGFIARLSRAGEVVWRTNLGGSRNEVVSGLAAVPGGLVVTGATSSPDFPVRNAAQPALRGDTNAFVARLSSDGTTLAWSTYLGGTRSDQSTAVAAAPSSGGADTPFIVVGGVAASDDFPTRDAQQPALAGPSDAFLATFTPTGALRAATYLGGSRSDSVSALAIDGTGRVHTGGVTSSKDLPTTPGAAQPAAADPANDSDTAESFVGRYGPELALRDLTYLGGPRDQNLLDLALDASGRTVVAGATDAALAGSGPTAGFRDGFITRLDDEGSAFSGTTLIGSRDPDAVLAIDVGPGGHVWGSVDTDSDTLPTTPGAPQPAGAPRTDTAIFRLPPGLGAPELLTYFGGPGADRPSFGGVIADPLGRVRVGGLSEDAAALPGASPSASGEGFIAELRPLPGSTTAPVQDVTATTASLRGSVDPAAAPTSVRFEWGPTTAYGSTTPARDVGAATGAVAADATIDGLAPGTEYHARLVATTAAGDVVNGEDVTFRTAVPPAAPPIAPPSPVAPAPPAPSPPPGPGPVALCGRPVVLLALGREGARVRASGLAQTRYAGRPITLRRGSRVVGRTTVAKDGTFTFLAPPSPGTTRYRAVVDGRASRALKLDRRLVLTTRRGRLIRGRIDAPRRSLPRSITFRQQTSCTKLGAARTVPVSRTGRFTVRLTGPVKPEPYALYRATVRLRGVGRTYTLPIAVR